MVSEVSVHGHLLWTSGEAEEHHGGELLTSWWSGSRERQKRLGTRHIFQWHAPSDQLPQWASTPSFNHPSIMSSNYESIHYWGQSPHDLMTSQWLNPPSGDQAFNTWACGGMLHTQVRTRSKRRKVAYYQWWVQEKKMVEKLSPFWEWVHSTPKITISPLWKEPGQMCQFQIHIVYQSSAKQHCPFR
jgi:hypothetical protein